MRLTSFGVYGGLQDQNLVENKPKLAGITLKFRKGNFGASYVLRDPQ